MAPEDEPRSPRPEYTLYRSRRRAAASPDEEPTRRSLGDLIIRAGAVAAAIGSIAAVVTLVWPDSPGRQSATLSNVSHERNVSLADFTARQQFATLDSGGAGRRPAEKRRGASQSVLAVVLLATTEAPSDGAGPTPPNGAGPTTPDGEGDTTTEPAQPEDEERTPMGSPDSRQSPRGESQSGKNTSAAADVTRELKDIDCGADPCSKPSDEVMDAVVGDQASGAGRGAIQRARQLLRVLRDTRVRESPSTSGSATREVLGVTVSFDLQLEGFKGRRSHVRWSLYSAREDRRVPRDWLINRHALSLRAKTNEDRASKEFWVPLPRRKGPFFVRVSAYDDEGNRFTYEDTKTFR